MSARLDGAVAWAGRVRGCRRGPLRPGDWPADPGRRRLPAGHRADPRLLLPAGRAGPVPGLPPPPGGAADAAAGRRPAGPRPGLRADPDRARRLRFPAAPARPGDRPGAAAGRRPARREPDPDRAATGGPARAPAAVDGLPAARPGRVAGVLPAPRPEPVGERVADGMLDLGFGERYSLAQVDVDSAAFKTLNAALATTARALLPRPVGSPDTDAAPALRSTGLAVLHDRRAEALHGKLASGHNMLVGLAAGATRRRSTPRTSPGATGSTSHSGGTPAAGIRCTRGAGITSPSARPPARWPRTSTTRALLSSRWASRRSRRVPPPTRPHRSTCTSRWPAGRVGACPRRGPGSPYPAARTRRRRATRTASRCPTATTRCRTASRSR